MEFGDASDEEAPPLTQGRERDVETFLVADDLHAPSHGRRQWSSMRFDHLHCQKVQCGMQHIILTMGMGDMHMCHRHNYLTGTQFPEKLPGDHLFI